MAESYSSSFNHPRIIIIPLPIIPGQSYGSPKLLNYMWLKWTIFQNYSCTPPTLGSLTLKPAAFPDVYLPSVASERRILNTNDLQNFEHLLNTNQKFFF